MNYLACPKGVKYKRISNAQAVLLFTNVRIHINKLLSQYDHQGFFFVLIKVIAAEGEQKASRALKEAADVIQESPAALQVNPGQKWGS